MLTHYPDLIKFNTDLLRAPHTIKDHPVIRELQISDPELQFLCPLTRAIFRIEDNCCDSQEAQFALSTCWLTDDSAIDYLTDNSVSEMTYEPGINLQVSEIVEHSIETHFMGNKIQLSFKSCSELMFCSEYYKDAVTASNLLEIISSGCDIQGPWNVADLISWLEEQADQPIGVPEGEDEPLCLINYSLTAINDLLVSGPNVVAGYHEVELENLNKEFVQRPDSASFCWLHYLDAHQADSLGLPVSMLSGESRDLQSLPLYPSWVPEGVDLECTWLDADQLQESYSMGHRRCSSAWVKLGCGSGWSPANYWHEEIGEDTDSDQLFFPDLHHPLLSIPVRCEDSTIPNTLAVIEPYLKKLAECAATS